MLQWIGTNRELKIRAAKLGVILALFFCIFITFSPALVQGEPGQSNIQEGVNVIQEPLGLPGTDIRVIIANIIKVALGLLGLVVLVLILYGGYLWMTAGGNEEQITSAKKILLNGTVGLAIILSAYGIVLLVTRILGVAGGQNFGGGGSGTNEQSFMGSGALGRIVKDHYPARDQIDVPRNAKIVISFRKPIKVDSISDDKNKSGKFGDCVNIGQSMSWQNDCDQLIMDNDHINIFRADASTEPITGAAVLASYENGKAFTIVIRPLSSLGSDVEKISYAVHLGKSVLLDDQTNNNPSIFSTQSSGNFYEWKFTTDTALDISPPRVLNVFPAGGSTEAKNTVIQVMFSEPVDPTGIQGIFNSVANADYFALDGNNIFLKSENSSLPRGNFRLTNGYRTLEFTPSIECGVNACGGKVYCLPVCDRSGANCQEDNYKLLAKAAVTFNSSSFESIPFSGVMDMSSNALDGNNNTKVDVAPATGQVFPDMEKPDNFFWGFKLDDKLDISAPILKQVAPGVDAAYVAAKDEWSMLFSKRMRVEPMYDIDIDEQPAQSAALWKVPRVWFDPDNSTKTTMVHRQFLDDSRAYYYPNLDSRIEDAHFNCFYPGKGPVGVNQNNQSLVCDENNLQNCCAVNKDGDPFCCNGFPSENDRLKCLNELKENSP